jgi:hypothetical protein
LKIPLLLIASLYLSFSATGQKTGIKGQLYLLPPNLNHQPQRQNIPYDGLPLEIFVHELTSPAEVDFEDGEIKKIYTPVVSRTLSKWNGSFKTKLPPGKYSVFVRYRNSFYGNLQDAEGNLSPAIVTQKGSAWITITLNYLSYP